MQRYDAVLPGLVSARAVLSGCGLLRGGNVLWRPVLQSGRNLLLSNGRPLDLPAVLRAEG